MATTVSRRSVLAAGAGAAAGLALPGAVAHAGGRSTAGVGFTLDAVTLDGGEQVVAITLDTRRLGRIDPASLSTATFTVHAKATSPIPIAPGDQIFSEYDLDRAVTAARVDHHGDVVLELSYAEGQVGGGTLGYIVSAGRNVQLDLTYTITQNAPISVRGRRPVTIAEFVQGRLSNPEVDAFSYGTSASGLKYRLSTPARQASGRGRRPLVVWLHGGGEGGLLSENYYDNETTLRANRGALGFATPEAQQIFAGAYVVAPQSFSYWLEDGDRYAPLIQEIVRDLARRYRVDPERIYVAGCSNGGYMSLKMTTVYPEVYAASVPVCGVIQEITDTQLTQIHTPTWLVASLDDDTVNPQENTIHAHDLIPGALESLYEHVIWNGYQFPGHWSWIYVARNDPSTNGTHIWQWMAQQRC
jgi:dipeptidyl aminopeptidase/acylaminoacyl peptidase